MAGAAEALQRLEQDVGAIRAQLEAERREARHKDFSLPLLVAGVAQAIVVAMLAWAVSDWVLREAFNAALILVKLGFAAVLQLVALTGFQQHQAR